MRPRRGRSHGHSATAAWPSGPRPAAFLVDQGLFPRPWLCFRPEPSRWALVIESFGPCRTPPCCVLADGPGGMQATFLRSAAVAGSSGRLWIPAVHRAAHSAGALVTVAIDPLAQVLTGPVWPASEPTLPSAAANASACARLRGPHGRLFSPPRTQHQPPDPRRWWANLSMRKAPRLLLALQTREQPHPPRQGHSNICTAQAACWQ